MKTFLLALLLALPVVGQTPAGTGGTIVVGGPAGSSSGSITGGTCYGSQVAKGVNADGTPQCVTPTVTMPVATPTVQGAVQLAPGQTSSILSTIASSGKTYDIAGRQTYTSPSLLPDESRPVTFNGAGCNYGTGLGASSCGNGTNWRIDVHTNHRADFNAEGITELFTGTVFKRADGDLAGIYLRANGSGGQSDSAEEGMNVVAVEANTLPTYAQSVFSGTTGTGQTSITMTASAFNSSGGKQYIAGAPIADKSVVVGTGTYTGVPVAVNNAGAAIYFEQPVSETYAVSVGGRLVSCTGSSTQIPQTAHPEQQVQQTDTCIFTNNETANAAGFAVGIGQVWGIFPEQIAITAVASAGTNQQSVTFTHRKSNAVGLTTLWQGGASGSLQTNDYQESLANGFPLASIVAGSFDAHTLVGGVIHAGQITYPPYTYHVPVVLTTLSRTGNTVTATGPQILAFDATFNNQAAAVLAGCSDSTMNGTITGVTESAAGVYTFTSPNSGSTTCASATIALTAAQQTHHLYPYAAQVIADSFVSTGSDLGDSAILNAPRAQMVEPNNMTLTNGDVMFQPLFPTFDGRDFWAKSKISTAYGPNLFNPLLVVQEGNGASGQNTALRIVRTVAPNTLVGGGGLNAPAPMTDMRGANSGNILELPMNQNAVWQLVCNVTDPTCSLPITLATVNGVGIMVYNVLTNQFLVPGSLTAGSLTSNGSLSVYGEGVFASGITVGSPFSTTTFKDNTFNDAAGVSNIGQANPFSRVHILANTDFAQGFSGPAITLTGLTPGNCVQVGTGGLLTTTSTPCGGSVTPVISVASSGATQTLSFAGSGDVAYDLTLSANCTISIATPSATGTYRKITLVIRPAGFTATFPPSSSAIVYAGGSPPTVSTSAITVITFGSTGTAPVLGGL